MVSQFNSTGLTVQQRGNTNGRFMMHWGWRSVRASKGAKSLLQIFLSAVQPAKPSKGKIDIPINNVGVLFSKLITETSVDDYAAIFYVNVRAPLPITKAWCLTSKLRPSLTICDEVVQGLDCPTQELGNVGHAGNAVAPGLMDPEMLDDVPRDVIDKQLKTTAVGHRVGTVDDAARIVVWLAIGFGSDDVCIWRFPDALKVWLFRLVGFVGVVGWTLGLEMFPQK
ncbi:hypothetical protein GQ44DRAFT_772955 [Phaeosphaeriaceae sp. PMI808]|nr:hypothetical protein GQ44DRAFT_772955 [Phaeosphaeriaceae sp. PMI808]